MPGLEWWARVSPHLEDLLELSEGERSDRLGSIRATDPELADRLQALLDENDALRRERFLEDGPRVDVGSGSIAGRKVGAYTLISVLGEGGMGTVWRGERSDGEVRQEVAIKLLAGGTVRPAWRERFLRERQLLASLNHPAIVRMLDAGRTDDGIPYLVMEYVDGQPLDVYARGISVRERLELFIRVCEAVSYAHQRLIVHRDLKPSNILVDRAGQPKLLDFGIARLLDDNTDQTVTAERVLTPVYASPEQVRGAPQTTATDVYSLGGVLYALLTGRSPGQTDKYGVAALGPERDNLPRATALNPRLPGDVDYVLRRARRYEPEARYASVDALAADVRALIESRPVEARSGDSWYRARKFLRRNRLPIGAAATVLGSLTMGLYVANRQRTIAQRRFSQIRQLANEFIRLDAEIRNLPGATQARLHIVAQSLKYLAGLGSEARNDLDLAVEIADAYLRIARVQGVPAAVAHFGEFAAAEESLGKAREFADAVLLRRPHDRRALLLSAEIAHDWMTVANFQDRRREALSQGRTAADHLERLFAVGGAMPDEIDTATHIYSNVASAYINCHGLEPAIGFARRALEISEGIAEARMRRASALARLSQALRFAGGSFDEALAATRESRAVLSELAEGGGTVERFNLANALAREGDVLGGDVLGEHGGISLNRPDEAVAAFQKAIEIVDTLAARDSNDYQSRRLMATYTFQMAAVLRHTDPRSALRAYDYAVARLEEVPSNARVQRDTVLLMTGSSYAARRLGQPEDAKRRVDRAATILREAGVFPVDAIELVSSEAYFLLRAIADHQSEMGQPQEAVNTYEELLTKILRSNPDPEHDLRDAAGFADTWAAYAKALRGAGRSHEAEGVDRRRRALWSLWNERHPKNPFIERQLATVKAPD